MRQRARLALIAGVLLAGGLGARPHEDGPARLDAELTWAVDDPRFGGLSGLEVTDDGSSFLAISDRGSFVSGRILRTSGRISGLSDVTLEPLKDPDGNTPKRLWRDAEGLALRPDGRIYVSFEGVHRVWTYRDTGSEAAWLPRHADFKAMQPNSSLEGLAIDGQGRLYTLPERSGQEDRPFPVYRYANGDWSLVFTLPRRGAFLPVGADFGPDGRFYLLERRFRGVLGFSSRLRRFTVTDTGLAGEETLLVTQTGRFDNLEGLSVWRDGNGQIRLTMISDDNFRAFQRTEFVEFLLPE